MSSGTCKCKTVSWSRVGTWAVSCPDSVKAQYISCSILPRLRCSPTNAGSIWQPRYYTAPPSPPPWFVNKSRGCLHSYLPVSLEPLWQTLLCVPSVHPPSVPCPPMLSHLHGLKAGSTMLVFNSSCCLLCSVLWWIAALLSHKMPSVLTLLIRLEYYLVGENRGILIWLLGLVFCHATYTSNGPEFLINSSSNELSL